MEKIEKILEFIRGDGDGSGSGSGSGDGYGYGSGSGSGDGYGYGDGDGSGSGSGYGYGYGDGDGYGYGDGYGSGSGSGSGDGYGDGDGSGSGSGYGYGDGDGYGYGYGDGISIKRICGEIVFYVDKIPTIFDHIHGNVARCRIVDENNFSLKQCFVVKNERYFAHENTIKEALKTLQDKVFADMDIEARIEEFKKTFKKGEKYLGSEFFRWHNILTGSCLAGRTNFVESGGYDLDKKYSVKEFIKTCENAYGGQVIKQLKKHYV